MLQQHLSIPFLIRRMKDCFALRSTLDGLLQIIKKEGVPTLWRGLDLNLLVGVPVVRFPHPLTSA